ncbi:MAG TPA: hypothetical protein VGU24_13210, partial [Microvirga sp.]|nr:hypothetical protein [Microvirga sp.]
MSDALSMQSGREPSTSEAPTAVSGILDAPSLTVPEPTSREAQAPVLRHRNHGLPTASWAYRDVTGSVTSYVARYEPEGSRKQIVPWTRSEKSGEWQPKGSPAPRPLFNLDQLAARPDAPVLVVEGE